MEEKDGSRHRGWNPATLAIDVFIGVEEKMGKKKRTKKNREWVSNPVTLDPDTVSLFM